MPAKPDPIGRDQHRPKLWIAASELDWVESRSDMGGPFASQGHSFEVAVARLHAENKFIEAACRREHVPFRPTAFWQLYEDAMREARPPLAGRPAKGETAAHNVTHRRAAGFIDARLIEWMDGQCKPDGPFETAGHLVETALRHLHSLDGNENPFPASGFSFNGKALWARYRKLAKA